MASLLNLRIRTRLYIGVAAVSVIALLQGLVGVMGIHTIDRQDNLIYEHGTLPISQLSRLAVAFERTRIHTRDILLASSDEELREEAKNVESNDQEIQKNLTEFKKTILTDHLKKICGEFEQAYADVLSQRARFIELVMQKKPAEAKAYMHSDGIQAAALVQNAIDTLMQLKLESAKADMDQSTDVARGTINFIALAIVIGIVLSLIHSTFIATSITKPIDHLCATAKKLANGDIAVTIKGKRGDEIGSLMRAFATMVEGIQAQAQALKQIADGDFTVQPAPRSPQDVMGNSIVDLVGRMDEMLAEIHVATSQVAAGAEQIADGSRSVVQGASQQADTIQTLSGVINQVAQKSKATAATAKDAEDFALRAKSDAEQGDMRMQEMLGAMRGISQASTNIAKIIKVIDEIAFQTNILALNAAVEAARAGQHGRGFAVVAEEVRNLAARSAKAASEIADMISGSMQRTEDGRRIADETAGSLKKIVEGVSQVSSLIGTIAVTSHEQATGFARITQGIDEVSQIVQNSSAIAEESSAACQQMETRVMLLREKLAHFKLKDSLTNRVTLFGDD